ncbi:hypothetical protein BT63DRAFT_411133 [Microthyrium microscopicum]|uniref:CCHC-type domain-containing protein n=1 Tax=Microthyrium microscopicum TaxID=703497 RepID=A0A6A6UJA6_9PEZI|nr:hypothetical protein BT63DRAFT_411133 [Microthyrium microscopicum]
MSSNLLCFNCGLNGHGARECRNAPCGHCRTFGHHYGVCPYLRPPAPAPAPAPAPPAAASVAVAPAYVGGLYVSGPATIYGNTISAPAVPAYGGFRAAGLLAGVPQNGNAVTHFGGPAGPYQAQPVSEERARQYKHAPTCDGCGLVGHMYRECPRTQCRGCGQFGHLSSACPIPGTRDAILSDKCFSCGQEGHKMGKCPNKRRK